MTPDDDHLRAFNLDNEVVGHIYWSTLGYTGRLGHACSSEEAAMSVREGLVKPKSKVNYVLKGATRTVRGLWCTLNFYNDGYEFGPTLCEWPTDVLDGKHFLVVKRGSVDRVRWSFLEYDGNVPASIPALSVNDLFKVEGAEIWRTDSAIYNVVLTSSVMFKLGMAVLRGVAHRRRTTAEDGQKLARKVAETALWSWLRSEPHYKALLTMFPDLVGHKVHLWDVSDLQDFLEADLEIPPLT